MTETTQKALDVLDVLCTEQRITGEEYATLAAALQEGPPVGDSSMPYTVFLIAGGFSEEDAPFLRLNSVNHLELGALLRIAMKQDFDMVIRREEQASDD